MERMLPPKETMVSPWPHRVAVALAIATFPLIWVGGLVTTYQAGMAVEDWPTTYGYNLFLYPWKSWIWGPFDLFIEHGHRLLGATVGLLTLSLVAACWLWESRRTVFWASVGALALVIFQGVLGGMRVLRDARMLALVHGCVGPAFFAYTVALATVTSRWWRKSEHPQRKSELLPKVTCSNRWALLTVVTIYIQIVLGAHVRHLAAIAEPTTFQWAVVFHVMMAVLVAYHVAGLWWSSRDVRRQVPLGTTVLVLLMVCQMALGATVWVLKFGWPFGWADRFGWAARTTLTAQAMAPSMAITAHVATGSLLLALAILAYLRLWHVTRIYSRSVENGGFYQAKQAVC
jgi:cytochrome c oxidase assembly protein subunit 15